MGKFHHTRLQFAVVSIAVCSCMAAPFIQFISTPAYLSPVFHEENFLWPDEAWQAARQISPYLTPAEGVLKIGGAPYRVTISESQREGCNNLEILPILAAGADPKRPKVYQAFICG